MNGPLLAKSVRGEISPAVTLTGHTACVLRAVEALFGQDEEPTPLVWSWLRFFGIAEADRGRFLRHVRVAAAAHDWGKANDGFQDMVTQGGEQVLRHEHLSGLLMADEAVLAWLRDAEIDEGVIIAAVISHHVKAGREGPHALGAPVGLRTTLRLRSDHDDFSAVWRMIQAEVGPQFPGPLTFRLRWSREDIEHRREALVKYLDEDKRRLRDDPGRRRWVRAVRAGLIVADSVGSAVVRMGRGEDGDAGKGIGEWVDGCFRGVLDGDQIWTEVTKRRIADLRERGRWDDSAGFQFGDERGFSEFQVGVASQGPRVLMTAPCGSGKTLAAWNWIKAQLDSRPAGRVLFLYPTRATATEGFRDYVSWAPEAEAALVSGTAAYELQDMFDTPGDPGDPRRGRKFLSDPRLFALGHWSKRIFSATADQFFPFMQYGYGPLCLLPLLVESVLVVDEVHSFDESMFSTLKRFLTEFPAVPVLCMTATLPVERRNALVECGLEAYPEELPADTSADANRRRYHVEWIDRAGAEELAIGAVNGRKRVLWVSNRVAECQAVFGRLRAGIDVDFGGVSAYCYHSRFTLEDRKKRHRELIHAFQDAARDGAPTRAVLGVTTQVCELSLDLNAEVLVTELAPIASLIQRMGRCNRDSKKIEERPIGRVYVLRPEPGGERPYEKAELDVAKRFIDDLAGKDVSQDQLQKAYETHDPREVEPTKLCPFLDSGPYAEARQEDSFRDIDEYTVPCVLAERVSRVVEALAAKTPIDGHIVPVPRRFARKREPDDPSFPRWLSVAPEFAYDCMIGFDETKCSPPGGGDR